jgi:hypothetical protein
VADRPLVRRRTAVTSALGGVALLAGCDHGDDLAPPEAGSTAPTPTPSAEAPEPTPDEVLVDDVVAGLGSALGVLAPARHYQQLRAPLAPLVHAHQRHLAVLEATADDGASAPVLASPADALRGVRRSERTLQAALVDAAGRAESGALARLLASMSASVTQHLAALPKEA